jgi:hypothetical protein
LILILFRNEQIFSIIFASSMQRNYSLIPSMIGSPGGLIWSFDNPYELFYFNSNNSLQISKDRCNETSFCLWYISPLHQFNNSLQTKYSFMGELNKWTFISRQKFSSLNLNEDNTQMTINVTGVPDELVQVLVYHSKYQAIIHLFCHFYNHKQQAQITINSTDVICS